MSRIGRLEARLKQQIEMYDKRFEQLECDHDIVAKTGAWMFGAEYWTECSKCKKFFGYLDSEQEYLELKLKAGKEKCASERKELEARLAVVKEENGKG